MNRWKTEKQFASWLGLCPDNRISGGKALELGMSLTARLRPLRMAAWKDLLQIGPGDREGPTIFRVDVGGHAKQGLNEPEGLYPKEETGVRSTVEHGEYVLVNS